MKSENEQVTFGEWLDGKGGIPIPLTMECLVTSMNHANSEAVYFGNMPEISNRRMRQVSAIRKRILRMDAERIDYINNFEACVLDRKRDRQRIAELEAALQKIANAEDIFYDEYTGVYFSDLQQIARKELGR